MIPAIITPVKLFSPFSCTVHGKYLSLPCQKIKCGTLAASSYWQFLYFHISVNNTAAPRRVCGNAPGSPAFETLTTRSAASLCQKSNVMATTITPAAQRAFSLRAWANAKRASVNHCLNTKSKFYTRLCEFPITRRLAIYVNLIAFCIFVSSAAVEQQPLVSVIATAIAIALAVAINKNEKKGGAL